MEGSYCNHGEMCGNHGRGRSLAFLLHPQNLGLCWSLKSSLSNQDDSKWSQWKTGLHCLQPSIHTWKWIPCHHLFHFAKQKNFTIYGKEQRKREIYRYPKAWAALTISTMYQQLLLVFFYMSRVSLKPPDSILGGFM